MSQIVNLGLKAVTEWNGLGRVGVVNGKLWCVGCTGAYLMTSATHLAAEVEFPSSDFGLIGSKHLRSAHIGARGGRFSLECQGDEMASAISISTRQTEASNHKAQGRRDIQGRYITITLRNPTGQSFHLARVDLFFVGRHYKPLR